MTGGEIWYRRAVPGPATHALVIGTSAYPHRPFGLPDLGSAATSARRFATWVRDAYHRPDAPVSTVRLLLAPAANEDDADSPARVTVPTRMNVLSALDDWKRDCCSSPENVAILYVCGHGAQETDDNAVVFVHDAGAQGARVLDEAIDVAGVRAGMTGPRSPRRQWYFVDACRVPASRLRAITVPLRGGITLDPEREIESEHRPLFFAAEAGGSAYEARSGTVFGRALLDVLGLDAFRPRDGADGGWAVTAPSLLEALSARVAELAGGGLQAQRVVAGGGLTDVSFVDGPAPEVPTTVRVAPPDAAGIEYCGAEIFDGDTDKRVLARRPVPILGAPVPAGVWTLGVTFDPPHESYRDKPAIGLFVAPPACERDVTFG